MPSNLQFFENLWWFDDSWISKWCQNQSKHVQKMVLRKHIFWKRILNRILLVLVFANWFKINPFSYLYRSCFRLGRSSIFRVRSFQKTTKKRFEKAFQNNIETTCEKNRILVSILASKIVQHGSEKRCKTKLVSRRYGNCQEIVAKQRKASFVNRPNGYAYD